MDVANRLVVIRDGQVEQTGTPEQLYATPVNPFVCDFLGYVNILHADGQQFYVRPHEIALEWFSGERTEPATVSAIRTAGPMVQLELRTPDGRSVTAAITHKAFQQRQLAIGEEVHLRPLVERTFD